MKQMDADVIIVGSGLVGLVAAHSLSCLGLRTTVIEKKNFLETKTHLNDTRTTAVSEGSRLFLEDLHLWEKLKNYAEPIKEIKVFDRTPTNNISFTNEKGNKKLGYVIENRKFSTILRKELQSFRNTRILYGANIKNIHLTNAEAAIYTSKHKIKSKLIVAADGKNSDTKDIVGNKTFKKKYSENAMVLNFIHKKNLDGIAYEIFLKNGPLAILPMKQIKNNYQSTVIWSNNKNILRNLNKCNSEFIANFMEEKIGNFVGKIIKINSKQTFPLSAHINDSFINKRLIYIGDAAHSIHPIAGQGWNLGVFDVKNLFKICKKQETLIGSDLFCKNYNNLSYNKAFQLYQITDKLDLHFKNNTKIYRLLSNLGFGFIQNSNEFKNKITKYAMGI